MRTSGTFIRHTDSTILSALITACSFIYIDVNEDGYPRLECLDGTNATGNFKALCDSSAG